MEAAGRLSNGRHIRVARALGISWLPYASDHRQYRTEGRRRLISKFHDVIAIVGIGMAGYCCSVITPRHQPKDRKATTRDERRKESRNAISECGVIKTRVAGMAVAELLDVSRSGLRVTAPCPLPVDTQIEVLLEDTRISGTVRNCVHADLNQFHVGIGNARSTSIATRLYHPTPALINH